jgi:hypothetical protein
MYPSAIAWEGRSLFDGAPIAVVVSNIGNVYSKNPKCGKYMAQATIIRTDIHPQDAILTGKDYSICGDCTHRGHCTTNSRGTLVSTRSCYVLIKGIISVYHAVKKGSYQRMEPSAISEQIRHRAVQRGVPAALRIGSYGDPAAVPTWVWKDLAGEVKVVTGYTHQWRRCDQALKSLMMASADTQEEAREAQSMGWRTFRILTPDQKPVSMDGNRLPGLRTVRGYGPEGQTRGDAAARQQTSSLLPKRRDGKPPHSDSVAVGPRACPDLLAEERGSSFSLTRCGLAGRPSTRDTQPVQRAAMTRIGSASRSSARARSDARGRSSPRRETYSALRILLPTQVAGTQATDIRVSAGGVRTPLAWSSCAEASATTTQARRCRQAQRELPEASFSRTSSRARLKGCNPVRLHGSKRVHFHQNVEMSGLPWSRDAGGPHCAAGIR